MVKILCSIFVFFALSSALYAQGMGGSIGGAVVALPEDPRVEEAVKIGAQDVKGVELAALFAQEKYQQVLDKAKKWRVEAESGVQRAMILDWEVKALISLDRVELIDALLADMLKKYPKELPVVLCVANVYHLLALKYNNVLLKDGKYIRQSARSHHSGMTSSAARDEVRAMQLADAVRLASLANKDIEMQMKAQLLMTEVLPYLASYHVLSDWSKLPDYGRSEWSFDGHRYEGAPLNAEGKLAFYSVPKSWEAAKNNGERLRWLFDELCKTPSSSQLGSQLAFVELLRSWYRLPEGILEEFPLNFEVKDNETILRLGDEGKPEVFTLPEDQQYLPMLKSLTLLDNTKENILYKKHALELLAEFYFERGQYKKIKGVCAELKLLLSKDDLEDYQKGERLLFGPQCSFVPDRRQWVFSGKEMTVSVPIRYRNCAALKVKVIPINVDRYMAHVFDLLKKGQSVYDVTGWEHFLNQLGENPSLVAPYLLPPVWDHMEELHFDPNHRDALAELKLPLNQGGLFLVEIKMEGNAQPVYRLLGVSDMVIVQRSMPKGQFVYLADAATGLPVEGAQIEVCVVRNDYDEHQKGEATQQVKGKTNVDGVWEWVRNGDNTQGREFIIARKGDKLAVIGMDNGRGMYNYGRSVYQRSYDRTTLFAVNSQPAYRPGQTVRCRGWLGTPRYGAVEPLVLSHHEIEIALRSPRGEKIGKPLKVKTDAYGGFSYEYVLPETAALGNYSLGVTWSKKAGDKRNKWVGSGHNFLVEEYKKPEFEVSFETPKDELRLGQTFAVTLQAEAYSGGPVTKGEAKIEVYASPDQSSIWANDPWFWLYKDQYDCVSSYNGEEVFSKTLPLDAEGKVHFDVETASALKAFGGKNMNYRITAEVRDASKRTISATTNVRLAASCFDVFIQFDRGYALANQRMCAQVHAQNIQGAPIVNAKGTAMIFLQTYNVVSKEWVEKEVQKFDLTTDHEGTAFVNFSCSQGGRYRMLCALKNEKGEESEVSKTFLVESSGVSLPPQENPLELLADKLYYKSGETAKILVKTNRSDPSVVGFVFNVFNPNEKRFLIRMNQSTKVIDYPLSAQDMPNVWVEAFTVSQGVLYEASLQVKIPPTSQCLQAEMKSSKPIYAPQEAGSLTLQVKDAEGKPLCNAQVALTIYDKALDYIGSSYPQIEQAFWGWTNPRYGLDLNQSDDGNIFDNHKFQPTALGYVSKGYVPVENLSEGMEDPFADSWSASRRQAAPCSVMKENESVGKLGGLVTGGNRTRNGAVTVDMMGYVCERYGNRTGNGVVTVDSLFVAPYQGKRAGNGSMTRGVAPPVSVRSSFSDMIKWSGAVQTDAQGMVVVPFTVAENLTTWMARAWVLDEKLQVGSATAEFLCTKDFLLRLQAPRFFVEKDEIVLSAIIQNKTKTAQKSKVTLGLKGEALSLVGAAEQEVEVPAGGEVTVDWTTKAQVAGQVEVTMSAVGEKDADAMKMSFPVLVHGMQQLDSWSCVVSPTKDAESIQIDVPVDRKASETVLELRVSPSLALSLLEALPFLSDYPHGCAEQTLNRFVPSLSISHLLKTLKIKLPEELKGKSLDSQQMQASVDRKKCAQNPLLVNKLKPENLDKVTQVGVDKLANMQRGDGAWNWFSGASGEGDAYITAQIVQGLACAKATGANLPDAMLKRARNWLLSYEQAQVRALDKGAKDKKTKDTDARFQANERDAYVRVVLSSLGDTNPMMQAFLVRDKKHLSMYGKILLAQELKLQKNQAALDELLPVITQFIEEDKENQTAWLHRDVELAYWHWYNNDIETQASLLKLMVMLEPKSERTSGLAKWLINNRKNGSYWASTRDTAAAIDALVQYVKATQEGMEEQSYELLMDGTPVKIFTFNKANLFTAENSFILKGDAVSSGKHDFTLRRVTGAGPLYVNASLSFFSLEDPLRAAGSDLKVSRSYTKVTYEQKDKEVRDPSGKIRMIKERVAIHQPLNTGDAIKSGELIEVQLTLSSKNDLEYLCLIDPKPAGCELDDVRSGYTYDGMMAYREIGDQSVRYYLNDLRQGTHVLKYMMRAERPGKFSALPSVVEAMYSPELRGNATEQKLIITE